jgi:hypothetical protein
MQSQGQTETHAVSHVPWQARVITNVMRAEWLTAVTPPCRRCRGSA